MLFHTAGGCKSIYFWLFHVFTAIYSIELESFDSAFQCIVWFDCLLRWSLPEIEDCLEEAGFHSVHFWIRDMPDTEEMKSTEGFGVAQDEKYEEVNTFQQQDAWNAYIVAVSK